jgi:hypothetical protein
MAFDFTPVVAAWIIVLRLLAAAVLDHADAVAMATAGLTLAGFVKGVTGLGYASCALPFLTLAFGVEPAMALVVAPAIATCFSLAASAGEWRQTTREFAPLYLAMLPGIAIGLALLTAVDPVLPTRVLGVVMISYGLLSLWRPDLRLSHDGRLLLQIPTGFANGILTGLTGSQVMPLLPYVLALGLPGTMPVQVINLGVAIASLVLGIGLCVAGVMTPILTAGTLGAVPLALLGVAIGDRLRRRLPERQLRSAMLLVLIGMGIAIMTRA